MEVNYIFVKMSVYNIIKMNENGWAGGGFDYSLLFLKKNLYTFPFQSSVIKFVSRITFDG